MDGDGIESMDKTGREERAAVGAGIFFSHLFISKVNDMWGLGLPGMRVHGYGLGIPIPAPAIPDGYEIFLLSRPMGFFLSHTLPI